VRTVFADTSGFYAALDGTDPFHPESARCFRQAKAEGWRLLTTNYVVHETWALVQNRLGWDAVDAFVDGVLPLCEVSWVDGPLHLAGVTRCRRARLRKLSLTDCVSFELMKQLGLGEAIACDKHLAREGIRLPKPPGSA
jgi:uncharacterized protein